MWVNDSCGKALTL